MIKSWMVIGGVTLLLAIAIGSLTPPAGAKWFNRLRRPQWLTFEQAIPVIWTVVFVCGAWSAYLVWEATPDNSQAWFLMVLYVLLELVTLAYSPAMFALRRLKVGTMIGATGLILAILLAIAVFPISEWATLLLLPYLIWSPIGTYTTWQMMQLNPSDA
jgi:tryptophan-rich sensory protein